MRPRPATRRVSGFAGVLLAALATTAVAQMPGNGNTGVAPELKAAARTGDALRMGPPKRPVPSVTLGLTGAAPADFRDQAGSVSSHAEQLGLGLMVPVRAPDMLNLSCDRELLHYRFDLPNESPARGALEEATVTRLGANYLHPLSKTDSWFFGTDVSWSLADGADAGAAATYGAMAVRRHAFSPTLALSVGLLAHTRLDKEPRVLPIPGVEWQISRRLTLRTAQGMALNYDLLGTRKWWTDLGLGFENRTIRLADDSPLGGGRMTDRRLPLTLAVRYQPHPGFTARLFGGVTLWQNDVFRGPDGVKEDAVQTRPALAGGLSVTLRY